MSPARTDEAAVVAPGPSAAAGEDSVAFAHRVLRAAILDGSLTPGDPVSQVRLAADLGISRTPLREAISRLMTERLVEGDFNRQVRVSRLDLADLDQIYAMRLVLEPVAIAATVPELAADDQARLTADVAAMDAAISAGDMTAFRARHRAFHLGLTAGGGERMAATLAQLWDHSERYRRVYVHEDALAAGSASRRRLDLSQSEHRTILDAALAGDVATCTDRQVAHMQRTVEVVFLEASLPAPSAHLSRRAADLVAARRATDDHAHPSPRR